MKVTHILPMSSKDNLCSRWTVSQQYKLPTTPSIMIYRPHPELGAVIPAGFCKRTKVCSCNRVTYGIMRFTVEMVTY